ncbi:VOC family protein [Amycolatopsis sp. NPDC059021]|uniref:VOC family protein n=1 Tax=Amycolatopsis sp. NPDC059021 TaxID=3346704 RepID=UPI00366D8ADE
MSMRMLSQLAHVELLTPTLERSTTFFTDVLGLEESGRTDQSVYLRCWGERFHHSVKLTQGPRTGVGHIGWRSDGQDGLDEAVRRIEASGVTGEWLDDETGHGPAYRFRAPSGQLHEVFWEVDRWEAPAELASTFPSRPQKLGTRGCALRQIDHISVPSVADLMPTTEWFRDTLGFRFMEYTVLDEEPFFTMLSTNERAHDLGLIRDTSGIPGRFHHVAFWVDEPSALYRACDALLEAGATLEYGPGRHGMGEESYFYTRDPSGLRIEVMSGGRRNYEPDWAPVKWTPPEGSLDFYRNSTPPDSILEIFPPDPDAAGFATSNPWE